MIDVLLLAGGKGTRLKNIWHGQKCLIPVAGVPFLAYVLDKCKDFKRFVSVGYKGNDVVEFVKNSDFNDVSFIRDDNLSGTFDAVAQAAEKIECDDFIVMNADTLFNIDLEDFYNSHVESGALVSVAAKSKERDVGNYMKKSYGIWDLYRERGNSYLNSGIYCINKNALLYNLNGGSLEAIFNYFKDINVCIYDDFLIDIGTEENYNMVNYFYKKFDGFFNYPGGD